LGLDPAGRRSPFGLDKVHIFNFRQRSPIPCYGSVAPLRPLRRTFAYLFEESQACWQRSETDLARIGHTRA